MEFFTVQMVPDWCLCQTVSLLLTQFLARLKYLALVKLFPSGPCQLEGVAVILEGDPVWPAALVRTFHSPGLRGGVSLFWKHWKCSFIKIKKKAKIHSCCLRRVLGLFSSRLVLIMPLNRQLYPKCLHFWYVILMGIEPATITLQNPSSYQLSHCITVLPCGTWQIAPANCSIHSVAFQKPSVSRKTQCPTVGSEDHRLNTVWLWSIQL